MSSLRRHLMALLLAFCAWPAAAPADDLGRWTETGRSTIPLEYYQGVASDPEGNLYFDGIHVGLYRTDAQLRETGRRNDVIPPDVHLREQYNHIGDIEWDAREGGRILLPLECYYPRAAIGQEDPHNTCRTGAIGVADARTLEWRYYVKLDLKEIAKAMWVTVSPDGRLLWTQDRKDLLAFDMDQISPAHAAPAAAPIRPVRRLRDVMPKGASGAVFHAGRLFLARQDQTTFRVWSLDLETLESRPEIEKHGINGESEGLDVFSGLGGVLHWQIQPYNTDGLPTYGIHYGTLLHFVERGQPAGGAPAQPARIRVRVRPRRLRAGRRATVRVRASATVAGRRRPVGGARVRIGRTVRGTDARGLARLRIRPRRAGHLTVRVSARGLQPGTARIRVLPRAARR